MATQEPRPYPGVPYSPTSADARLIAQTLVTGIGDICARLDRIANMQTLADLINHGFAATQSRFDQLFVRLDSLTTTVGVNSQELSEVQSKLDQVFARLDALKAQGEKIMSVADDLKAGIALLNDETNANAKSLDDVAARIAQLQSSVKNSMTDQEVADLKAALGGVSDLTLAESARLKSLAQDPNNPVPPAPPQLAAMRSKKP